VSGENVAKQKGVQKPPPNQFQLDPTDAATLHAFLIFITYQYKTFLKNLLYKFSFCT